MHQKGAQRPETRLVGSEWITARPPRVMKKENPAEPGFLQAIQRGK
jgi:hypothetical protein